MIIITLITVCKYHGLQTKEQQGDGIANIY